MEKVLILTYYWPPSGGPGVQRWLKFVKYLPGLGFQPVIVTVDPQQANYPVADASLLDEVPAQLQVHTTPTREPYAIYKKLTGKKQLPYSGFVNENEEGGMSRISRFIRGNLFVPDARIGWNAFAVKKASELIRDHNIKYLITTSPPHSTQLAGIKLKESFPYLHWIADLRDPWTDIFYYRKMLHTSYVRRKDKKLEEKVLKSADVVVTVSDYIKEIFQKKLEPYLQDKIKVVTNGYDEEDFAEEVISVEKSFFTISYVGTLAEAYNLKGFVAAIKNLHEVLKGKLQLRFTGHICEKWKEQLQQLPGDSVSFQPHVPHREAISEMRNADMLLLVIPEMPQSEGIITGKLFEYLACEVPVLGIGPPEGNAAEILRQSRCGEMFAWEMTTEIQTYIEDYMLRKREWHPRKDVIQSFSRYQQAGKLVNLMTEK